MSGYWESSYEKMLRGTVEETVPVIKNLFREFLDIDVSDEIVYHLVKPKGTKLVTPVSSFVNDEQILEIIEHGYSPSTDMKKINFPLQFASTRYCEAYFGINRNEAQTMKWLISFYAIFHEALHIYHRSLVGAKKFDRVMDSFVTGNPIHKVIRNVVLDVFIENNLAQDMYFVKNVINYGKNIFFSPSKIIKDSDSDRVANVNYLHGIRCHEFSHVLTDRFEVLYRAEELLKNHWENTTIKSWTNDYPVCVGEIYKLFEEEMGKEYNREKAREERFPSKPKKEEFVRGELRKSPLDSSKEESPKEPDTSVIFPVKDIENIVFDISAKEKRKGAEREIAVEKSLLESKIGSIQEIIYTKDASGSQIILPDYSWIEKHINEFFLRKKTRSFTNYNQVSGVFDITQPATVFNSTSFATYKRSRVTQDRPDIVIALDASYSMRGRWANALSSVYHLYKGFIERRFSASVFSYTTKNGQAHLNMIESSMLKDFKGKKTSYSSPDKRVFSSQKFGNATPEYYAIMESAKLFNFNSNKEKVLIIICDGLGNVHPLGYSTNSLACNDAIEMLEKRGVRIFYGALDSKILSALENSYGEERVFDCSNERKFSISLPKLLNKMVTTFS